MNLNELINKLKEEHNNRILYVKVVDHLHEELIGCLYLNHEIVNGYKVYYEIRDKILYIQGRIVFDNVAQYFPHLNEEDQEEFRLMYERYIESKG